MSEVNKPNDDVQTREGNIKRGVSEKLNTIFLQSYKRILFINVFMVEVFHYSRVQNKRRGKFINF